MSKQMGIYCKAYLLRDLRAFPGWSERPVTETEEAGASPQPRSDEDVVYLQEGLVVTADIFRDEKVIFDRVDDAWKKFCSETLGFAIPDDVLRASRVQAA